MNVYCRDTAVFFARIGRIDKESGDITPVVEVVSSLLASSKYV